MKTRLLGALLVVAMLAAGVVPVFAQSTPSGTIVAYAGHQEEWARLTVQEFQKKYPNVKVEFIRLSGGQALARIRAERHRPQASVWWEAGRQLHGGQG